MSFEWCEDLQYNGDVYATDRYPLDTYIQSLSYRLFPPIWPSCSRGYLADWRIEGDRLLLAGLRRMGESKLDVLFPGQSGDIPATWYSGVLHAWRGPRRNTGFPYRSFHNEEVVFEIERGLVRREWVLDLHALPDQTDDELRLTIPPFLWPERLKTRASAKIVVLAVGARTEGLAMAAAFQTVGDADAKRIGCGIVDSDAEVHQNGWFDSTFHYPVDILPLRKFHVSAQVLAIVVEASIQEHLEIAEDICLEASTETAAVIIAVGNRVHLSQARKIEARSSCDLFIPVTTQVPLSEISAEKLVNPRQKKQIEKIATALRFFDRTLSHLVENEADVGHFISCVRKAQHPRFISVSEIGPRHAPRALERVCQGYDATEKATYVAALVEYCPGFAPSIDAVASTLRTQCWFDAEHTTLAVVPRYDRDLKISETRITLLVAA